MRKPSAGSQASAPGWVFEIRSATKPALKMPMPPKTPIRTPVPCDASTRDRPWTRIRKEVVNWPTP